MDYLDWEIFEDVVTDREFHMVDSGPLFGPVTEYKLRRDADLQLIIETTSATNGQNGRPQHVPGSVFCSEDTIQFEDFVGGRAVGKGLIRNGSKTIYKNDAVETVEFSSLHSVEISYSNKYDGCYLIEWIDNLSSEFHWPSLDKSEVSERLYRIIEGPISKIEMTSDKRTEYLGRSCAQFVVDGMEVVVGKSSVKKQNICQPGYIIYKGTPSEESRRKIRDCLSFALGCYLIYLGETVFDKAWKIVASRACSSIMSPSKFKELNGYKPAPLGFKYQSEISNEILGCVINALYEIYDLYELRGGLWRYWHAINAPIHIKAAGIGAALEGLVKRYVSINVEKVETKIIPDTKEWKSIRDEIHRVVAKADISESQERMMLNKINSINTKPIGVLFEDVFSKLGLEIGKLEKDAWMHRNSAAHGGGVNDDNVVTIIRETKVLQIMFNRMLLALAEVKTRYVDFYNLGWPLVELQSAIKDDRGVPQIFSSKRL